MEITTIGLDLAKNVFQVHGAISAGEVVVKKMLRVCRCEGFSSSSIPAWSASRRAGPATTGRARLPSLATRCA